MVTSSAHHDVSHTLVVTRVNREVVTSPAHHDVSHTLVVMRVNRELVTLSAHPKTRTLLYQPKEKKEANGKTGEDKERAKA